MSRKYADWLRIAAVATLLYVLSQVTAIYLPVILAVILAFILNPMVDLLTGVTIGPWKVRLSRGWACLLAIVFFTLIVGLILTAVFTPFVKEFSRFMENMPALLQRIHQLNGVIEQRRSEMYLPQFYIDQAFASISSYAVRFGQRVLEVLMGFASQVISLVAVPVLAYYTLKDWRMLRESCVDILPPANRGKGEAIIKDISLAVSGYIHGQVLVSIIIGLLVFGGMYLMRVDYPLVLGLLAMLTETIPIIGPIVGAAPAILLAYFVSPTLAVKVIFFYLLVHQIENQIVVPKVMGTSVKLHPVTVILGLLVGGQLFGIAGMILAVPALAILKVLFKHLWHYN